VSPFNVAMTELELFNAEQRFDNWNSSRILSRVPLARSDVPILDSPMTSVNTCQYADHRIGN
jgi:hypothetical protein